MASRLGADVEEAGMAAARVSCVEPFRVLGLGVSGMISRLWVSGIESRLGVSGIESRLAFWQAQPRERGRGRLRET